MKMLIVKSMVHEDILINLDNVTSIIPVAENECNVYFIERDDYLKVRVSLKDMVDKIKQLQELEK